MKAFLKNHAALLSGALCLLTLFGVTVGLFARAGRGTYEIVNVTGDEALLASLTLPMELSDGTHAQELTLQNGALTHTFRNRRILSTEQTANSNVYVQLVPAWDSVSVFEEYTDAASPAQNGAAPSLKRTVDKAGLMLQINYSKHYNGLLGYLDQADFGAVTVLTDTYFDAAPTEFLYTTDGGVDADGNPTYYPTGQADYAEAYRLINLNRVAHATELDGSLYALTPTHSACGGDIAIYRVDDWHVPPYTVEMELLGGYSLLPIGDGRDRGKVTAVISFPAAGIDTLRLDAVDGKLCVLLVESGRLTLRVYTPQGALLNQTDLGPYAINGTVFSDLRTTHDGDTVVSYRLRNRIFESDEPRFETDLYAVALGSGALLSHLPAAQTLSAQDFGFARGRWVLLAQSAPWYANEHILLCDACLLVLDAEGAALCACDIRTDAWQDDLYHAQGNRDWGRTRHQYMQKYRTLYADMSAMMWR